MLILISGLLALIGGIILCSRVGTGQVSAGAPLLMDAVAAAYIGYAMFGAKKPNVIGTFLGSVLIGNHIKRPYNDERSLLCARYH